MDPVVLVVDDNDDNRFTLSMHLETCGYSNIVSAENGREALEKMRSGPVDLVLLDIMMPVLDGYGVLEEMRSDVALRDIPVVMISALEDINSVVRCIELGATDYLTKPFNPVLLKARVDNLIEKSRYRAQEAAYLDRIESERRRADELLATVLPRSIVRALKRDRRLAPRRHEDVAVLFCDVVGFTAYSEKNPPEIVFAELETLIDRFEEIAARHGLEKIKTIGDAFMATANLLSHLDEPVRAVVACALDMLAAAREFRPDWAVRIGDRSWAALGRDHGQDTIPIRRLGRHGQHRRTDRRGRPAGDRQPQRPRLAPSAQPSAGPLAGPRRPQGQGKAGNRRMRSAEAMMTAECIRVAAAFPARLGSLGSRRNWSRISAARCFFPGPSPRALMTDSPRRSRPPRSVNPDPAVARVIHVSKAPLGLPIPLHSRAQDIVAKSGW